MVKSLRKLLHKNWSRTLWCLKYEIVAQQSIKFLTKNNWIKFRKKILSSYSVQIFNRKLFPFLTRNFWIIFDTNLFLKFLFFEIFVLKFMLKIWCLESYLTLLVACNFSNHLDQKIFDIVVRINFRHYEHSIHEG